MAVSADTGMKPGAERQPGREDRPTKRRAHVEAVVDQMEANAETPPHQHDGAVEAVGSLHLAVQSEEARRVEAGGAARTGPEAWCLAALAHAQQSGDAMQMAARLTDRGMSRQLVQSGTPYSRLCHAVITTAAEVTKKGPDEDRLRMWKVAAEVLGQTSEDTEEWDRGHRAIFWRVRGILKTRRGSGEAEAALRGTYNRLYPGG